MIHFEQESPMAIRHKSDFALCVVRLSSLYARRAWHSNAKGRRRFVGLRITWSEREGENRRLLQSKGKRKEGRKWVGSKGPKAAMRHREKKEREREGGVTISHSKALLATPARGRTHGMSPKRSHEVPNREKRNVPCLNFPLFYYPLT